MDNAVALAAISLAAAISAGMFKQLASNLKAQERNTDALERLVREHKRGNDASERRNGHLGELIIQQGEQTKEIAATATKQIIEGVTTVSTQNVGTLNVEQSNIAKETVEFETIREVKK